MASELSLDRLNIFIDVSRKYFTWEDILQSEGINHYSDKGDQLEITCPFHEDKRPSCRLNKVTGQYHCFSCDRKGTYTRFLWELHGKSQSYSRFCEQILRSRRDIQVGCGFTSLFNETNKLSPEITKRRIFKPTMDKQTYMSITTLGNKVRSLGNTWENLVASLTWLQHEVAPESVYATLVKQHSMEENARKAAETFVNTSPVAEPIQEPNKKNKENKDSKDEETKIDLMDLFNV